MVLGQLCERVICTTTTPTKEVATHKLRTIAFLNSLNLLHHIVQAKTTVPVGRGFGLLWVLGARSENSSGLASLPQPPCLTDRVSEKTRRVVVFHSIPRGQQEPRPRRGAGAQTL